MSAKRANLLSFNANKHSFWVSPAADPAAGFVRGVWKRASDMGAHATSIRQQATRRLDMLRGELEVARHLIGEEERDLAE